MLPFLRRAGHGDLANEPGRASATLASECLAEEGLPVPVETMRQWLKSAGLWSAGGSGGRTVVGGQAHRRRRTRKEHGGEMLQMDGSHHDWFEGRRGWAVLMVMIDDATGRIYAQFFEEETLDISIGE